MENLIRTFGVVSTLIFFVSGCANTPDVKVNYYLPKSNLRLEVVRTATCDSHGNLFVASTVIPTVSHMADRSAPKSVAVDKLDGYLSSSSLKFKFYEDGRLKDINTTSTGHGGPILESVIRLVDTSVKSLPLINKFLLPFDSYSDDEYTALLKNEKHKPENRKRRSAVCGYINSFKDNTLTLRFEGSIKIECCNRPKDHPLESKEESKVHMDVLEKDLGKVTVSTKCDDRRGFPVTRGSKIDTSVLLAMRAPVDAIVTVMMGEGTDTEDSWIDTFAMALPGNGSYEIPIPRSAAFGKQAFSLAIAPSGAVTEISYGKGAGVAQGIGVGQSLIDTVDRRATALERLATLKAEADLIAAQQRLVRCRADPETCK